MKSVLETMSSFVSLIAIFFVIVGMFQSCQALNEAEESKERLKELQKEIEDQLQSGLIDENQSFVTCGVNAN